MDATVCNDVVAASVAIDPFCLLSARIGDACSLVVLVLVVAVALFAMAAQVSPVHFTIVVFYSAIAINCDYVKAFACSCVVECYFSLINCSPGATSSVRHRYFTLDL